MNIELTPKEAKLVSDLMDLYDKILWEQIHERDCGCDMCKALENVGNCHASDWNSLQEKTNQ